ncbi:hypothetical protein IscW_ISCW001954, partial [Ixodes scapularis]
WRPAHDGVAPLHLHHGAKGGRLRQLHQDSPRRQRSRGENASGLGEGRGMLV